MIYEKAFKTLRFNTAESIFRWSAPLAWFAIIIWLSLTPAPPQFPGVLGWDKLLHAGAYGLLTVLIAQLLLFYSFARGKAWWYAIVVAVCCGAMVEIMQLLTNTGRTAEWWDLVADAVGALAFFLIFRQWRFFICRSHEHVEKNLGRDCPQR